MSQDAFALHAKMVTALSFVPNDDIDRYVDALAMVLPGELVPLLNWLEDIYIGRPYRRGTGRRQPLFPTEMWNMYQRNVQGEDRIITMLKQQTNDNVANCVCCIQPCGTSSML